MCCFSGRVERVDSTNIFARMIAPARQLLVYEMKLEAKQDVAMILPIPVSPGSGEDEVRFRSLEQYPEVFEELDGLFRPSLVERSMAAQAASIPLLAVHKVGAFDASFVPSLADFHRLDQRFRIPEGTIESVPTYRDWGFAVFRLAATRRLSSVHPMAFDFPTREGGQLFFPTVHVHDGWLFERALFAHQLYAQGLSDVPKWQHSSLPLGDVLARRKAEGLFDLEAGASRLSMRGEHPNVDLWAAVRA